MDAQSDCNPCEDCTTLLTCAQMGRCIKEDPAPEAEEDLA